MVGVGLRFMAPALARLITELTTAMTVAGTRARWVGAVVTQDATEQAQVVRGPLDSHHHVETVTAGLGVGHGRAVLAVHPVTGTAALSDDHASGSAA
jgi:hypothetical protein